MRQKLLSIIMGSSLLVAACSQGVGPLPTSLEGEPESELTTADTSPLEDAGAAPVEGIKPKGDRTTIPEFNAFFVTLTGQADKFENIFPRSVDYNLWYMNGDSQQYEQTATYKYFHRQLFNAGTLLPDHPDCTQEILISGKVQLTCEGKLPFVNGQMLRLIVCGQPNSKALKAVANDARRPIPEFIDRAFVHGDKNLWDLEFCPERRYIDYVFHEANLQLRFPLEAGKIYFVTQFPKDYIEKPETYGIPAPNQSGIHNRAYKTSYDMSHFLFNGRILQVIMAAPAINQPTTLKRFRPSNTNYTNFSYSSADSKTPRKVKFTNDLPDTTYCQGAQNWPPEQIAREKTLFELVNQQREQGRDCGSEGYKESTLPLDMSPTLRCTARVHSQDMNDRNFVSHTNPEAWTIVWRALHASFVSVEQALTEVFSRLGENITQSPETAEMALDNWLKNDRHCANLMDPYFTHMGVGYHPGNAAGPLWTLTLGTQWN